MLFAENSIIYAYCAIFKSFVAMISKTFHGDNILIFNLWEKLSQCLNFFSFLAREPYCVLTMAIVGVRYSSQVS